jgi:U4/U6.U5 tri-snRNP-associated protein 1
MEEPIVKASVTENNGEISCSIEETNRIRALLGLKPLKVDSRSKEQESIDNFNRKKEQEAR